MGQDITLDKQVTDYGFTIRATLDNALVGEAGCVAHPKIAYLDRPNQRGIWVADRFRRQGIATLMVQEMLNHLDVQALMIEDVTSAIAGFYDSIFAKFQEQGRIRGYEKLDRPDETLRHAYAVFLK